MVGRLKFYDTNALLDGYEGLKNESCIYLSTITLKELENIKTSNRKDSDVKYKARKATRFLKENEDRYKCIITEQKHYDLLEELKLEVNNDNLIMATAYLLGKETGNKVTIITNDICFHNICKQVFKLKTEENKKVEDDYTGYLQVTMTDDEMAKFYEDKTNKFGLLTNQYLLIKNINGEVVDKLKWNGNEFIGLRYEAVQHKLTDRIKPRNVKQELLFDMLQDKQSKIKIIEGLHGTGKTLIMMVHALSMIERGKFDKIVYVVQNQQVSNTNDIGALPGTLEEKLLPYTSIIADKVGGQFGLDMLLSERKLEVVPLAFLRGRNFSNSIVVMSEAENTTTQHMKLILSRLEESSILIMDGDFKQTDKEVFKSNNGLNKVIERLKGYKEFATVTLTDVERSRVANLARLLDD